MYLLQGADDERGVACLGGECFGDAGRGFIRLSCAQSTERLLQAAEFIAAVVRNDARLARFVKDNPTYRLDVSYSI
jgi:aspartate aminotransferase